MQSTKTDNIPCEVVTHLNSGLRDQHDAPAGNCLIISEKVAAYTITAVPTMTFVDWGVKPFVLTPLPAVARLRVRRSTVGRRLSNSLQTFTAQRSERPDANGAEQPAAQTDPALLEEPFRESAAHSSFAQRTASLQPQRRDQPATGRQQWRPLNGSQSRHSPQGRSYGSASQIPKQMTTYINAQQKAAIQSVGTSPPGSIMLTYMSRMHLLCSEWQEHVNHVHMNAILHGAAQISLADEKSRGRRARPQDYGPALEAFLLSMLRGLHQMMPSVTSRASSSILWSFARLKQNPDDLLPGTVDALSQCFLRDLDSATGQAYSSLLLACADLQVYPCKGQLLQEVIQQLKIADTSSFYTQALANIIYNLARLPLLHPPSDLLDVLSASFLKKMRSHEADQRPKAQELANVAWSLVKLPSAMPSAQLLEVLCDSFLEKLQSQHARERPKAQEVANFYWALARLPSAAPSAQLLTALSDSFLEKMQSQSAHERPNAQELANVILSLAKLPAAQPSAQLLEALSDSFLEKLQSPNAPERPHVQGVANFVWALARLPSAQPSVQLLDALCDSFSEQMQSSLDREHPKSQELANFCWGLAKMPSANPSAQLLDALCHRFQDRLQSNIAQQQPNTQEIATFAWALQQLKHEPPTSLAPAMLDRMLHVCQDSGQHLSSQVISNFLFAVAEIRLPITQEQADALLTQLLAQDTMILQTLANSAWSLAVSGRLQLSTFRQLLNRLQAESAKAEPLETAGMRQLYQSLDWLRPTSDSSLWDQKAWSQVEEQLLRLGKRPHPQQTNYAYMEMQAALTSLGVQHSLGVGFKGYTITAVVYSKVNGVLPILCSCSPLEFFSNAPFRLTGRAVFRHDLLSREAFLIDVPYDVPRQGASHLAEYLRSKMESVAEGTLDAYRQ